MDVGTLHLEVDRADDHNGKPQEEALRIPAGLVAAVARGAGLAPAAARVCCCTMRTDCRPCSGPAQPIEVARVRSGQHHFRSMANRSVPNAAGLRESRLLDTLVRP
jgi:hypothetical protein